ncbi:unnamed protein product [Orchesella dallaii]|uniref:Protein dopey-1 n=1 Tax=Orchesella dallaii TaxID=48710 RepID=A0ABP1R3L2_9HEXA
MSEEGVGVLAEEVGEDLTNSKTLDHDCTDTSVLLHLPTNVSVNQDQKSAATTPEPASISSSLFTSWYSSSSEHYDAKTYKTYVQSIDKCLKSFEYSIEWPDLIAALTKLNKVISTFNTSVSSSPPPPLPRTQLITKRLSQCLHPNLPSGVHLKTLETFDLIFQGFKHHDYVHLESDLFSFVSGLLPLWSYAAISVKPKLLSIYETHLLSLRERLRPALNGIMLSLFNGLVDDGVEHDIKIRISTLLTRLESDHGDYKEMLNSLIRSHSSIHFPIITHIVQINYNPPPDILMKLITSPNTLVQRNALELLKQYDTESLEYSTMVLLTKSTLETLLKRDMSVTRRVFSFVEPRQSVCVDAIRSLINDCIDGVKFTRILSTLLDNPSFKILPEILPSTVKYLMKCEYNVSVNFLSSINSKFLQQYFIDYLFAFENIEDLESRVIVLNYILKLELFEIPYPRVFTSLSTLEDTHVRVILQMIRLHYNTHHDSFLNFYNSFMGNHFNIEEYELLYTTTEQELFVIQSQPPELETTVNSTCFEFVLELLMKSTLDDVSSKYVILSSCVKSNYSIQCIRAFIHFQDTLQNLIYNTHAVRIIFNISYGLNQSLLNSLKYPEKYLLSTLHDSSNLKCLMNLDIRNKPLVVLKLVDPTTMNTPYRRLIANEFVNNNPNLVLTSILKYLEFNIESKVLVKAKSESNLESDNSSSITHASSQTIQQEYSPQTCAYDSARVSTLLEKLDFVIQIDDSFLSQIDLIVLLSKLTILCTISNSNEKNKETTLSIQTHALRTIRVIVTQHGEEAQSFVYDSILAHLSSTSNDMDSLLWELHAIPVIDQFLKFDLQNYTLASVVQKSLTSKNNEYPELHERVHVTWLNALGSNLQEFRTHANALVLITFTCVCKNLQGSDFTLEYKNSSMRYLTNLLTHVLKQEQVEQVPQSSFLSSLFGSNPTKLDSPHPTEMVRNSILGKLDNVITISCTLPFQTVTKILNFLLTNYEKQTLQSICKCFEINNLESLIVHLKIPASSICYAIDEQNVKQGIKFLQKYVKHDKTLELHPIIQVCKTSNSTSDVLNLITSYLKTTHTNRTKELQDIVVKTIENTIENREFIVLEAHVPNIFDLVWGNAHSIDSSDEFNPASASSASVRDQKVIINVVHSIVLALVVAIKASSPTATSSYSSSLHVLEQISHHSYLRKSWKKEIFELITNEPSFFYFTPECLGMWKIIVDNLFTQDRSTFSELITRLTQTTQMNSSALSNIFSSKDTEVHETRASLLKRLAFVIHSSEKDQYAKYITNIQEKIAEALKIGATGANERLGLERTTVIPGIHNSVFLCFRIMVLKFNCNVLTTLWPIIVHEVVAVLTTLQSLLDGMSADPVPPNALSLYLQTLKLLNYLFTLPSDSIPHFQLYKWAFTDGSENQENNNNVNMFVPYVTKLRNTALQLFPNIVFTCPLKTKQVSSIEELCSALNIHEHVTEHEWEVIDFCDGGSPDSSDV